MLSQGNDLPLHARASTDKRRHCRDDFVQCHVRLLDRQCPLSKMLGLQASGEKRSPLAADTCTGSSTKTMVSIHELLF